jgi:hypothetical protein
MIAGMRPSRILIGVVLVAGLFMFYVDILQPVGPRQSGEGAPRGPGCATDPQEMFRHLIADPIPSSVRDVQGVGDCWQGYHLFLRFTASNADIDAIIATGFQSAVWSRIETHFQLPSGYDRFTPPWNPKAIFKEESYEARVKNSWTHDGTHFLVIDRSTRTAYFVGQGA